MFEQQIEETIASIKSKTIGESSSITLKAILGSDISQSIKNYFDLDVKQWMKEEHERLINSPHFDYSDEQIRTMFEQIEQKSKPMIRFSLDEFSTVLDHAVKLQYNFVCRPQWTLAKFVFGEKETVTRDSIYEALDYFVDYEYYNLIIKEYLHSKNYESLHRDRFEELVSIIDNEVVKGYDSRKMAQLTKPVFELFSRGTDIDTALIPIEALSVFFDDKTISPIVERLDAEKESIPMLSLHDLTVLISEVDFTTSIDISNLVNQHLYPESSEKPGPAPKSEHPSEPANIPYEEHQVIAPEYLGEEPEDTVAEPAPEDLPETIPETASLTEELPVEPEPIIGAPGPEPFFDQAESELVNAVPVLEDPEVYMSEPESVTPVADEFPSIPEPTVAEPEDLITEAELAPAESESFSTEQDFAPAEPEPFTTEADLTTAEPDSFSAEMETPQEETSPFADELSSVDEASSNSTFDLDSSSDEPVLEKSEPDPFEDSFGFSLDSDSESTTEETLSFESGLSDGFPDIPGLADDQTIATEETNLPEEFAAVESVVPEPVETTDAGFDSMDMEESSLDNEMPDFPELSFSDESDPFSSLGGEQETPSFDDLLPVDSVEPQAETPSDFSIDSDSGFEQGMEMSFENAERESIPADDNADALGFENSFNLGGETEEPAGEVTLDEPFSFGESEASESEQEDTIAEGTNIQFQSSSVPDGLGEDGGLDLDFTIDETPASEQLNDVPDFLSANDEPSQTQSDDSLSFLNGEEGSDTVSEGDMGFLPDQILNDVTLNSVDAVGDIADDGAAPFLSGEAPQIEDDFNFNPDFSNPEYSPPEADIAFDEQNPLNEEQMNEYTEEDETHFKEFDFQPPEEPMSLPELDLSLDDDSMDDLVSEATEIGEDSTFEFGAELESAGEELEGSSMSDLMAEFINEERSDQVTGEDPVDTYGDLRTAIPAKDKKLYIKSLFKKNASSYDGVIEALNSKHSWREASEYIDEVFLEYDVDMYSKIAIKFTDEIYKRYAPKQ